jgi:hypothetical protein
VKPEPLDADADAEFAQAFREGRATDSFGNLITGENKRWSVPTSALGPGVKVESQPTERNPNWLRSHETMTGTDGQPVMSASDANHPLNAMRGFVPAKARPVADQRRKQVQDRKNIAKAFLVKGL